MNALYIDQSANDLRLNLVYSALDTSNLNVIVSQSIDYDDVNIEVGIIGASHYLSIKHKDSQFSEVFACLELNSTTQQCIVKKENELSSSIFERINEDLQYKFDSEILNWNKTNALKYEQFSKDTHSNSKDTKAIGLSHIFPFKKDAKFEAKTQVFVIKSEDKILINTLHAYPNEEKLVFTQTSIEKYRNIYE